MKICQVIVLLGSLIFANCAQLQKLDTKKPIEIEGRLFGDAYLQNGEILDRKDVQKKLEDDPKTSGAMKKAGSWGSIAQILSIVGGVMIGYPIGYNLSAPEGAKVDNAILYAGIGVTAVAIPLAIVADGYFRDAVDLYNSRYSDKKSAGHIEPGTSWSPFFSYSKTDREQWVGGVQILL